MYGLSITIELAERFRRFEEKKKIPRAVGRIKDSQSFNDHILSYVSLKKLSESTFDDNFTEINLQIFLN